MDPRTDPDGDDLSSAPADAAGNSDEIFRESELLTVIVPVYNENENILKLIEQVEQHLKMPFQLLVVYDFDEDTTVPVARQLSETRPWIHLCKNDIGRGPANALRAGFQAVGSGPALVVMADLSDDLRMVDEMLRLYREGNRIVCGSRYMRGGRQIGGPVLKRMLSRAAGLSLCWFARFPTHDATNNFRLYDAGLVNEMGIKSQEGFEIALELTARAFARGVKIAETPTTWTDRTAGDSRFQLMKWLPHYL
ncbi:MAG: glycosyltransferase, partial [Fuerstiella sp.]|nr:glycosyltransferase [Fuerstiella sp.]